MKLLQSLKAAVLVVLVVSMTGCFGSFKLTTKLHSFNDNASNSKFVKELIFLGFCIIPAYPICTIGDALIFNSIEFWTNSNPLAMKDGDKDVRTVKYHGDKFIVTATHNALSIEAPDKTVVNYAYSPLDKSWYLLDGQQRVKVVEMKKDQIFTYNPESVLALQ